MQTEKDIAIAVAACDNNIEWADTWLYCYNTYIDWDISIVLISERKQPNNNRYQVITTGRAPFSRQMQMALELIKQDCIIFTPIDLWLTKTVDWLKQSYADFIYYGMNALHFIPSLPAAPFKFKDTISDYLQYSNDSPYLMSLSISMWRKKFLMDNLMPDEDPWQTEIEGTRRLSRQDGLKIYGKKGLERYYINAIKKGKLSEEGKEYLKKIKKEG